MFFKMKSLNKISQAVLSRIFSKKPVAGIYFPDTTVDLYRLLDLGPYSGPGQTDIIWYLYGLELGLLHVENNFQETKNLPLSIAAYKDQFKRGIPCYAVEVFTGIENGKQIATAYAYRIPDRQRVQFRKLINLGSK
jgi:hypothetical protein